MKKTSIPSAFMVPPKAAANKKKTKAPAAGQTSGQQRPQQQSKPASGGGTQTTRVTARSRRTPAASATATVQVQPAPAATAPAPAPSPTPRRRRTTRRATAQPAAPTAPKVSWLRNAGSKIQSIVWRSTTSVSVPWGSKIKSVAAWAVGILILVIAMFWGVPKMTKAWVGGDNSQTVIVTDTNRVSTNRIVGVSIAPNTNASPAIVTPAAPATPTVAPKEVTPTAATATVNNTAVGKIGGTGNVVQVMQLIDSRTFPIIQEKSVESKKLGWPSGFTPNRIVDLAPCESKDYDETPAYSIPPHQDWEFTIPAGWNVVAVTKMPTRFFNKAEGGVCTDGEGAQIEHTGTLTQRFRNNSDKTLVIGFCCTKRPMAFSGFSH